MPPETRDFPAGPAEGQDSDAPRGDVAATGPGADSRAPDTKQPDDDEGAADENGHGAQAGGEFERIESVDIELEVDLDAPPSDGVPVEVTGTREDEVVELDDFDVLSDEASRGEVDPASIGPEAPFPRAPTAPPVADEADDVAPAARASTVPPPLPAPPQVPFPRAPTAAPVGAPAMLADAPGHAPTSTPPAADAPRHEPTSTPPTAAAGRRAPTSTPPPIAPPARAATVPPPSPPARSPTVPAGIPTRFPRAATAMPPPAPPMRSPTVPAGIPRPIARADRPAPLSEIEPESALDRLVAERAGGDAGARAERLAAELERTTDSRRAAALAYELGELCDRHLRDEARAVKAYGKALQADPSLRANLWAIRRVFYRRGLWPNLVKLIGAELRFAPTDRQKADLLIERAQILEDRVGDREGASQSYEQALAAWPGSVAALLGLERTAGDDERRARALRGLADTAGAPARRAAFLLELARLAADLGRPEEARAALADAAATGAAHEAVAAERERFAAARGDTGELLAALESRAARRLAQLDELAAADDDAARRRLVRELVGLRRRQASLARGGGDPEAAWSYLQEALALAPSEPLVRADLAELAEALGKYEELAELVAGWESSAADPARALGLSLKRAGALARAGRVHAARDLLAELAQGAPGYLPLVAMRERDALGRRDFAAAAELAEALAEGARAGKSFGPGAADEPDLDAAAAHFTAAGDLHALVCRDAGRAEAAYRRALEARAGYAPAVDALVGLFEEAGRVAEAAALLEEQGDGGVDACERLVDLRRAAGDLEGALRALDRALAAEPSVDRRRRRADLLADLGRDRERAEALVELAGDEDDPDRAAGLRAEAAFLFAELGDGERAARLYEEVLEAWPDDAIARAQLAATHRRAGRWRELVAALRADAERLVDGPEVTRALREAAGILAERLDAPAEAAEIYRQLLDRAPGDLGAALNLAEACRAAGDEAGRIAALEAAAEAAGPAHRPGVLVQLAAAQERAGRVDAAADSLRAARSPAAAVAGYALAAAGGDPEAVSAALGDLAAAAADPELRAAFAEERGWLEAFVRGDLDAAATHFAAAAERGGAHLGLALVAARRGAREETADALADLAERITGSYARSALLLRSALVAEVRGDEQQAATRLEAARQAAPDDGSTAVVVADRLAPLPPDCSLPVEALRARAELCAFRAALSEGGAGRNDWELERADALERAGDLAEAAHSVASVLDRQPGDVRALQLLRRIARRGGDRKTLARASFALAKELGDRDGRLELLREAAEIFDREESDVACAVAALRRIVAEDVTAPEAARLEDLLREHDDAAGLYDLYTRRLNQLEGQERIAALLARAELRERTGDLRGAARDLRALSAAEPEHRGALRARADLLVRMGEPSAAAPLYRRLLEGAEGDERAEIEAALAGRVAPPTTSAGRSARDTVRPGDEAPEPATLGAPPPAEPPRRTQSQARSALDAARKAREADPLSLDAVRELVRAVGGDERKRRHILGTAAEDVRAAITRDPARVDLYERLAAIGQWSGDGDGRFFSLSALEALGAASAEQREAVARCREALGAPSLTAGPAPTDWGRHILPPAVAEAAGDVWNAIAGAVVAATDATPAALGFGRGDRVKPRELARTAPLVADAMAAFEVAGADVYLSGGKPALARAVSGDKPALCLGADVAAADTPGARFLLGRALLHLRLGTGTAAALEASELATYLAAAMALAGHSAPDGGARPREVADAARALERHLGRRGKKELAALGERLAAEGALPDADAWRAGVSSAAARVGLLLCGDLAAALEALGAGRGGRALADDRAGLELCAWSVTASHVLMRRRVGWSEIDV